MQGYFTLLGAPTHGKSVNTARKGTASPCRAGICTATAWREKLFQAPMQSLFKCNDFARSLEADFLDRMPPVRRFAVDNLIGGVLRSAIHEFPFHGCHHFFPLREGNRCRWVVGLHLHVILTTCQVRTGDGGIVMNEDILGILRF